MKQKAIELINASVYYGAIQALKGINFYVEEGEMVALVGSNGAGKSSLLKAIMGQVEIKEGELWLKGKRYNKATTVEIVNIGIQLVPEGRQIFPDQTVENNLRLGAYLADNRTFKERLERIYARFPILKERRKQLAGTMSGGQQQILAIARALISEPGILLIDEPSLGLDPIHTQEVFEVIEELHQSNLTLVVVEQALGKVLSIANRGYLLESGFIVYEDQANRMLDNAMVRDLYFGYKVSES